MKKILRNWFINSTALAIVDWFFTGIDVPYQIYDFLLASFLFTILTKLVRPVYNLTFLPLHIITLGMFRWISAIISLGLTVYLTNIKLEDFYFSGIALGGINIRPFTGSTFLSLIAGALFLNITKKAIRWILKTK